MKLDILAIGVHPDDIELACAGTLLGQIAQGNKVGLLDLTRGELGTRGTPELRLDEAEKSRQLMGAEVRDNVGIADGFFQYNEETVKKIIPYIRKYRPEIVLCNAINDRHPDHGRAAKLVADACYYSGLKMIATNMDGAVQKEWRPKQVYHYIQDYHIEPDFVVDISENFVKKIELVMAFSSQFYNPNSTEKNTPISSKAFIDFLEARAASYGRPIGAKYGEGYTVNRYLGVKNLFDLK
jgi:bacillithiol biosynthesis deacetylase BshB1